MLQKSLFWWFNYIRGDNFWNKTSARFKKKSSDLSRGFLLCFILSFWNTACEILAYDLVLDAPNYTEIKVTLSCIEPTIISENISFLACLFFEKKKSRGFVIIEVYALSSAAWLLISSLTASKTLRLWQTTVGSCLLNSCLRFCLYLNVVTVVQFINWNQTFEAP